MSNPDGLTTVIAQPLREMPRRLAFLAALGFALVGADLLNAHQWGQVKISCQRAADTSKNVTEDYYKGVYTYEDAMAYYAKSCAANENCCHAYDTGNLRAILLALAALVIYVTMTKGNLASLGLTPFPSQGWRYWCVVSVIAAIAITLLATPLWTYWWWVGGAADEILQAEGSDAEWFYALVIAPLVEEIVYRMAVCVPVAARFGPGPAIILSGILFCVYHVLNGNANPVNLIAGFFLAWAFLKSNCLLVPISLHAVGNLLGGCLVVWIRLW